ncbi:MAG: M48 family metallopeptidase [Bacteroidales bacterium]|nr:M48 family metallopeptidase [Bacteroidales bacterium]
MELAQIIFILIVAFLVFDFMLDNVLSFLNMRNWKTEVHPRMKDHYPEEKYQRAREYAGEKRKLGLAATTMNVAIIIIMLFAGGFALVDEKIAENISNPIWQSIIFFGILGFASDILNLPFAHHSVFVIEEKYGFNRSTKGTFWGDKFKSWFLAAFIGGGLFWIIIKIYFWIPEYFWLITWGVITFFMLFMTLFYSNLIVPMFNKQKPLEEGELRDEIEAFARKNNFKLDNIFVIDGSKRSTKANAYFTGLGPKKRIVLYDTLIAQHSYKELVAILAHEIGHYKKKHSLSGFIISTLQIGLMLFLFNYIATEPAVPAALGMNPSFHASLLVFGMLLSPVNHILSMLGNVLSRKHEFQADRYAFEKTRSDDLGNALIKLSVENLSNLTPHPLYVYMHYSHPPLIQRLEALDRLMDAEKRGNVEN